MRELDHDRIISLIPELNGGTLKKITKGYSFDLKYVTKMNGKNVLLRLYDVSIREHVQEKIEKMRAFFKMGVRCQQVLAYGEVLEESFCYTIFSFIEGQDGEVAIPSLTEDEQYTVGYEAGGDLWKMHQLSIESSKEKYMTFVEKKFEKAVERYCMLEKRIPQDGTIINYVRDNIQLIGESGFVYAHHDFHAGNLIIRDKKYVGVIDFNRCGVNTAFSEFDKLEMFSTRLSIPFSKGMIDGYFKGKIPDRFWQIRSVHMAQVIIFHMNWATDYFPEDLPHAEGLVHYILDMYDGFTRHLPKWYETSRE